MATAYADAWAAATAARRDSLRNDLVCRCLPFAGRMARRYAGRGEPLEDLQQVARIGLINAVDRYNPGRGSFTAFAVITVCGELKRHFRDKTWDLHVARRLRDLSVDLQHATVTLTQSLQREPTTEELACHLGVSAEQIRHARLCGFGYTTVPLSTPTHGDGSLDLGDTIGDPDPNLETLADTLAVIELMHLLPQRIQHMLALRFFGNLTQAQIAAEVNISQMHVSRLLTKSLSWLRAAMLGDAPPPWIPGEYVSRPVGMQIRIGRFPDAVKVRISGEVDRDTADRLRLGLHTAVEAATDGRLVIDVSGMPYAATAAVAVLRDAVRAAALAHVEVTLIGVRPDDAPVIATAGLAWNDRSRNGIALHRCGNLTGSSAAS